MNLTERITADPEILGGKPVVKGTRLAVEFLLNSMAQGWIETEILRNYPGFTADDLAACLHYASELLRTERIYPFAPVSA